MDSGENFSDLLEDALQKKRNYLETTDLQKLKDQVKYLQNGYKGIFNLMLKKSLIHEDPYRYDKKISDIEIPSSEPFAESSREEEMSIRLSDLDLQLEFIDAYYDFSLDRFTMGNVKKLANLVKYIHWEQVTENVAHFMTRNLAFILTKIRQGTDNLSTEILNDALNQMAKASKLILQILKEVSVFYRESYKLEFRQKVLPRVSLTPAVVQRNINDGLREVKQKYTAAMGTQPFYQALITEVLQEEFGEDGPEMKEVLLDRLKVEEQVKKKKKQKISYTEIILEGVRHLASSTAHLENALKKLQLNNTILQDRQLSFGEKFKRWMRRMGKKGPEKTIYEIEYFDTKSSGPKTEKIDFNKFIDDGKKRIQILANLASKMSTQYARLQQSPEDKVYEFLSFNLQEMQLYLRRLPALDAFFKTEALPEQKQQIKGIKVDITGIKNGFVKANQKKHEYIARKEEAEQLKRLGITQE